jgi:hypothetical protein
MDHLPSEPEVRAQCEAICTSREFARLRKNGGDRILRYLIDTLYAPKPKDPHETEGFHERDVALHIYGGEYGDESNCSKLRGRMRPLRTAIEAFNEHSNPPIVIEVPLGGYKPTVSYQNQTEARVSQRQQPVISRPLKKRADDAEEFSEPIDEAVAEVLEQQFHHYHLTFVKPGTEVWIYKTFKFHLDRTNRILIARAAVLSNHTDKPKANMYTFTPSLRGPHLVIEVRRVGGSDLDMGIEVYPYADVLETRGTGDPLNCLARVLSTMSTNLFCVRIHHTWVGFTFATSIGILSKQRRNNIRKEGPIEAPHDADFLQAWVDGTMKDPQKIERLPRSLTTTIAAP